MLFVAIVLGLLSAIFLYTSLMLLARVNKLGRKRADAELRYREVHERYRTTWAVKEEQEGIIEGLRADLKCRDDTIRKLTGRLDIIRDAAAREMPIQESSSP